MSRNTPRRGSDSTDTDHVRAKTVVTSISRITERAPGKEACLVVIYGQDLGRKYNLESPTLVLGRSSKCDIQIDQESVSRAHSKIMNQGKTIRIRDLGSTNGTYVNDEQIEERTLTDGDLIKIGRTIFKFLSGGNIERAYHEEIYRLTTVDGLTQIFNKRYFMESLEREIARSNRYRREMTLVMFDIDHFKQINDTYGHLAGDQVLKSLASTIKAKIRREDLFARYGGEEFAIVLPEIDGYNAQQFAEKIRRIVEITDFFFEGTKIPVTISMGVAVLDAETSDAGALIKKSDERLYEAKKAGRNCVRG
ncbi:MAG: GGDEF domain-containing protein [Deltaproteobacteria bacterium]|nr:GGDEF domain-containing protein [Deltaproteobacteria bacterium]